MARKINWNNIALIFGVSLFDIAAGAYDRIVNNSGMLKDVSNWYAGLVSQPVATAQTWNATHVQLATTMSGFGLLSVVLIVIAAVGVLGVMFSLVGCRAA